MREEGVDHDMSLKTKTQSLHFIFVGACQTNEFSCESNCLDKRSLCDNDPTCASFQDEQFCGKLQMTRLCCWGPK